MNISGVLVHTRQGEARTVATVLEDLPGVEVHMATSAGSLIVTIEEPDGQVGKTILDIERQPGVLSAALVYQQSETDSKLEEPYDAVDTA